MSDGPNYQKDTYTYKEYLAKYFPSSNKEQFPEVDSTHELGVLLAISALSQIETILIDLKPVTSNSQ